MVERASAFHHRRLQGEQPIKHPPSTMFPPYYHYVTTSGLERADDGGAFLHGSSTLPRCGSCNTSCDLDNNQVVLQAGLKEQSAAADCHACRIPSIGSIAPGSFLTHSLFFVLTSIFQLEGAYGRACSVKETGVGKCDDEEERVVGLNNNLGLNPVSLSGSREDTVSPMASQRTGNLSSIAKHCVQII